jgi:uncharacterized Tic20 family protein
VNLIKFLKQTTKFFIFIFIISISAILLLLVVVISTIIALCLVAVIFAIIGAIKANNKELFNYPLSIPFIK